MVWAIHRQRLAAAHAVFSAGSASDKISAAASYFERKDMRYLMRVDPSDGSRIARIQYKAEKLCAKNHKVGWTQEDTLAVRAAAEQTIQKITGKLTLPSSPLPPQMDKPIEPEPIESENSDPEIEAALAQLMQLHKQLFDPPTQAVDRETFHRVLLTPDLSKEAPGTWKTVPIGRMLGEAIKQGLSKSDVKYIDEEISTYLRARVGTPHDLLVPVAVAYDLNGITDGILAVLEPTYDVSACDIPEVLARYVHKRDYYLDNHIQPFCSLASSMIHWRKIAVTKGGFEQTVTMAPAFDRVMFQKEIDDLHTAGAMLGRALKEGLRQSDMDWVASELKIVLNTPHAASALERSIRLMNGFLHALEPTYESRENISFDDCAAQIRFLARLGFYPLVVSVHEWMSCFLLEHEQRQLFQVIIEGVTERLFRKGRS